MRIRIFAVAAVAIALAAPSTGASQALAAASDRWHGPALTTKAMPSKDRVVVDRLAEGVLATAPGQVDGIWVGIWDPRKGYYIHSYGNADTASATAATADDHGRIGSITKTFISTLILQQVAKGVITKGTRLRKVLPDVVSTYPVLAPLTIEQLLTMRTGVPDYAEVPEFITKAATDPAFAPTPAQLLDVALAGVSRLGRAPYTYSNTNYVLLGLVLEKLTGTSASSLVTSAVGKVGMKHTALPAPGDNTMPSPASTGYNHDAGLAELPPGSGVLAGPAVDTISAWGWTAGSMYSTIADLGRWAATGFGNSLLPMKLAEARLLGSRPINKGSVNYSEGVMNFGKGWIGHLGQVNGWESLAGYNTRDGAAVVVIVNESGGLTATVPMLVALAPDLVNGIWVAPQAVAKEAAAARRASGA